MGLDPDRFARLARELELNVHVQLDRFEARPPRPGSEVAALLERSPFCPATRAQLAEIYAATDGLSLAWSLRSVPAQLAVDPAAVTGEVELVGLAELVDNAEYLDIMGDMGSDAAAARLARLHPIALDEQRYGVAIDLDLDRDVDGGARLVAVADDGSTTPLEFGVGEWIERLFLCRGYRGFGPISAGVHAGGEALRAVVEGLFGERDLVARMPALAQDAHAPTTADSLEARVRAAFAKHELGARVVVGRKTDPYPLYAVFRDDFARFDALGDALGEVFAGASALRQLGFSIGSLCVADQSSWDLGQHGAAPAFWSLIDEQLQGLISPAEVADRCAWIVAKTRDRYAGLRQPELLRERTTALADLAVALDAAADPELRELAAMAALDWKSAPELIDDARRELGKRSARVIAALERLNQRSAS